MRYRSTRNRAPLVTIDQALQQGLAPDGGLYIPEELPHFNMADFAGKKTLAEVAKELLQPFFHGSSLAFDLEDICGQAFNFPAPLKTLKNGDLLLELFHGSTAAFKDFGAGFLASCLSRLAKSSQQKLTILVATSGDTGGAVASAFYNKENVEVWVLYPKGRVSKRQELQLSCWGGNIKSFAVEGSFDDCQQLVKDAFAHQQMREQHQLTSANSINVGRLLPQACYYAHSSLQHFRNYQEDASYIIPTGNLGNALACVWAKVMGFPIDQVVLAQNANRPLVDWLEKEQYTPRASIPTLANAMDVGAPSNYERLAALLDSSPHVVQSIKAYSTSDETIKETIKHSYTELGETICPHTACALATRARLPAQGRFILVATAHPAKFETIIEPLLQTSITPPAALERLLSQTPKATTIRPQLDELRAFATPQN